MNYVRIIFNFLNSEQVKVRYSDVFALQMFAIHIPTVCSLILSVEAYLQIEAYVFVCGTLHKNLT